MRWVPERQAQLEAEEAVAAVAAAVEPRLPALLQLEVLGQRVGE